MRQAGYKSQRVPINYFEGVNSTVQRNLAKVTELEHAENARSTQIGVIEKREGQEKFGTGPSGAPFTATANYGIYPFKNEAGGKGIVRVSENNITPVGSTLYILVYDYIFPDDFPDLGHFDAAVVLNTGWKFPTQAGGKTFPYSGLKDDQWAYKTNAFADDSNYATVIDNNVFSGDPTDTYTISGAPDSTEPGHETHHISVTPSSLTDDRLSLTPNDPALIGQTLYCSGSHGTISTNTSTSFSFSSNWTPTIPPNGQYWTTSSILTTITTTGTSLTETGMTMATNQYAGGTLSCNGKTMHVNSNTATTFVGPSWSVAPGDGHAWSVTTAGGAYRYQSYHHFAFGLPEANPVGFEMEVKGKSSSNTVFWAPWWFNKTANAFYSAPDVDFTTTETAFTYGSPTYLPDTPTWSWGIKNFSEEDFYMVASDKTALNTGRTDYMNYVKMKVYYTPVFPLRINCYERIIVEDSPLSGKTIGNTIYILPTEDLGLTNIYYLSSANEWTLFSDPQSQAFFGSQCSFSNVEGQLLIANKRDNNRLISSDGATVLDSTEPGDLYNSPSAAKISFYKNRIYLANFTRNGTDYPTMVARSSYPLGIIALFQDDVVANQSSFTVTDTKYFYTDTGMNEYDVYRGGEFLVAFTCASLTESKVNTTAPVSVAIQASDEIWVHGTYDGKKQYRWLTNTSSIGRDVKQYDTFKLSGGTEDGITLLETIGNVLMVGNNNNLMSWNDYNVENFDLGIGCVSPTGYIKLLGTLYFLHYSGIFTTTGSAPTLISRKVEKYIKGATKAGLEASTAGRKGLSVFFTVGDVTLYNDDGSLWKVLPDVCLEYHIANQDWYVHTNVPANNFASWISDDGAEHLIFGHTGSGKYVKEFLTGSTDDGDEIFFRADTKVIQPLQDFELFSNFNETVIQTVRGNSLKCFVALDDGEFYALEGTLNKGVTILKMHPIGMHSSPEVKPPIGRFIRLSFRDSSEQRCRILQAAIVFTPSTLDIVE